MNYGAAAAACAAQSEHRCQRRGCTGEPRVRCAICGRHKRSSSSSSAAAAAANPLHGGGGGRGSSSGVQQRVGRPQKFRGQLDGRGRQGRRRRRAQQASHNCVALGAQAAQAHIIIIALVVARSFRVLALAEDAAIAVSAAVGAAEAA